MPSISHGYLQPTRNDMTENGIKPQEQEFRYGVCTVNSKGVSRPGANDKHALDSSGTIVEVRNTNNVDIVDVSLKNPSDGELLQKAKVFTMQVRRKDTGEIILNGEEDTFKNVYSWTKRSITILASSGGSGSSHPFDRSHTITFPYDVEVYDPVSPRKRS